MNMLIPTVGSDCGVECAGQLFTKAAIAKAGNSECHDAIVADDELGVSFGIGAVLRLKRRFSWRAD